MFLGRREEARLLKALGSVRRCLDEMTEREDRTPQIGTGGDAGVFLKGLGAVMAVGGLACIVAAVVNLVRFGDRAGAIGGTTIGLLFVLGGRYLWRVPGRPVVELTDAGIIFHADVDPGHMLYTRLRRTVLYRWQDIEAIEMQRTRVGTTILLRLDRGPERGVRMVPITAPSPEEAARLVADIKRLSAGARRDSPTEWVSGVLRPEPARKLVLVIVLVMLVVIVVLEPLGRR